MSTGLAGTLAELEEAKRRIREAARSIAIIGCDRKCHPNQRRWFRHQPEHHTDFCRARSRYVDAAKTYAHLVDRHGMQQQLEVAYEAELDLFHIALRKARM